MKTVTIIGWNNHLKTVVEVFTTWPDEMDSFVAVARASREADVVLVERVLVEEEEENALDEELDEMLLPNKE